MFGNGTPRPAMSKQKEFQFFAVAGQHMAKEEEPSVWPGGTYCDKQPYKQSRSTPLVQNPRIHLVDRPLEICENAADLAQTNMSIIHQRLRARGIL